MRVCEHDGVGMQPLKFPQPIEAAIDHYARAAVGHKQRCMHAMPSHARLHLAACAEERQFHQESLVFFADWCAIYLRTSITRQDFGPSHLSLCKAEILRPGLITFPGAGSRSRADPNGIKMQNFSPAARANGTGARQKLLTSPVFKSPMCRNCWSTARKSLCSRVEWPSAFTFRARRWIF
jgi:hypothetical protein